MTITIEANENSAKVQFILEQAQEKGQPCIEYLFKYITDAINEKVQREAAEKVKAEERAWLAKRAKKRTARARRSATPAA